MTGELTKQENARCHRTVYITTQNVGLTSKLQIGLSPEMG